jgi:hypothetical protein
MDATPPIIQTIKNSLPSLTHTQKVELYNNTLPLLKKAIETGNHEDIIRHSQTSICCLEDIILHHTLSEVFNKMMSEAINAAKENEKWQDAALRLLKKHHPDFDANSEIDGQVEFDIPLPCISDFGDYCSFTGHADQLNYLKDIVNYYNDLSYYKNSVDNMLEVVHAGIQLRKFIENNPGYAQGELRDELAIDTTVINKLCSKMEKYKILKREKAGDSYKLTILM